MSEPATAKIRTSVQSLAPEGSAAASKVGGKTDRERRCSMCDVLLAEPLLHTAGDFVVI